MKRKRGEVAKELATEKRFSVAPVIVDARKLVTIQEDSVFWSEGAAEFRGRADGWIVRLKPPTTVTDARLDEVKRILVERGAAAVRTMPRPRPQDAPGRVELTGEALTPRKVVEELLVADRGEDAASLRTYVESVMGVVGL